MTAFLRGLSKTVAPRAAAPMMPALRITQLRPVCRMLDALEAERADLRDRAILVLHREHLGDGEIARLRWTDIVMGSRSVRIKIIDPRWGHLRRTFTVHRRHSQGAWAGEALADWRATTGSDRGEVFCLVQGARRSAVDEAGLVPTRALGR